LSVNLGLDIEPNFVFWVSTFKEREQFSQSGNSCSRIRNLKFLIRKVRPRQHTQVACFRKCTRTIAWQAFRTAVQSFQLGQGKLCDVLPHISLG
jgi:hypothetical protein